MRRNPALESQSSFERIQQLVKKEGKIARNLVAWSVPAAEQAKAARGRGRAGKTSGRRPPRSRSSEQLSRSERMCLAAAGQYSNSALGGKECGRPANKSDVHARYWSYLFDNLFRAVDEIYKTCEVDGSVIECQVDLHASVGACGCTVHRIVCALQEVMMTLDACHRDFSALIHRIEMERQLETYPQHRSVYHLPHGRSMVYGLCVCSFRPSGVAWEVRKTTSPSKLCQPHLRDQAKPIPGRRGVSGRCVRSLDMSCSNLTWADRVRGKAVGLPKEKKEKEKDSGAQDQGTKEGSEIIEAGEEVEDQKREGQEGEEVKGKESRERREDDIRDGEEEGKGASKELNQGAPLSSLEVCSVEQEGCEEEIINDGKVLALNAAEVRLIMPQYQL